MSSRSLPSTYAEACEAIRLATTHPKWGSSNTEMVVRNCKRHGFPASIRDLPAMLADRQPTADQREAFILTASNFV